MWSETIYKSGEEEGEDEEKPPGNGRQIQMQGGEPDDTDSVTRVLEVAVQTIYSPQDY